MNRLHYTILEDPATLAVLQTKTSNYLTSVAGTNTITAAGPAGTTYGAGIPISFIPAATNTGATTINITPSGASALGAKNVFYNGAACAGGEIKINVPCQAMYDGTQFNLLGSNVQNSTFTATATAGWTTTPTAIVKYSLSGSIVVMDWPNTMSGTSNATNATFSGVPVALRPAVSKVLNGIRMIDNSGSDSWGLLVLNTDGTGTFYKDPAGSNWTNTGTKTIDSGTVVYTLA